MTMNLMDGIVRAGVEEITSTAPSSYASLRGNEMNHNGTWLVWVALVIIAIYVGIVLLWTDSRLDKLECQEDQACWNCETMGNRICG